MSTCLINSKIYSIKHDSCGFSGITHSLSALAFFFIVAGFYPSFLYSISGGTSAWNIIATCFIIVGFSLFPDLDNTRSTAHSALGVFGSIMSSVVRNSSVIVQKIVGTKYDKDRDNPHRKLWHTPFWWLLICILAFYGLSIQTTVNISRIGSISFGNIIGFIVLHISILMAFESLLKDVLRKAKNKLILGNIIVFIFTVGFTCVLFSNIDTQNLQWIAGPLLFGALIHIVGDMFTVYGCPIFFPLIVRGKFFYNVSLAPIESGGTIEKTGFTTVFVLLIVVGVLRLVSVI